jgi:beta-phosphoglucomutase family hydrolase
MAKTRLGLPDGVQACLFDLDGVITETARLHAQAWKQLFDAFLSASATRSSQQTYAPFDSVRDYELYVDGKPRDDGTRSFLTSRGIQLPDGTNDDPATADTVKGLGERKNDILLAPLRRDGIEAYPGSVRYVRAAKQVGMRIAVVSSSKNCHAVLAAAGIADLFDVRIDGVVAADRHLSGKPSPDTYLAAAQACGVASAEATVFEDALAGVEAARAGKFGFVVGIDRVGQADALRRHGADIVVADLAALLEAG